MERKRNINSIIHDQLLGQLSEEEEKRLQVWIESSLENKENYESLMRDTDLSERYRQFATVDEEQAWKKFQEKHFQVRGIHRRMLWRYAAIFMIPIIIGAAIWVGMWRNADTVPVRVQDDQLAMIRSEKMGKQKATLVLVGGQEIELKSASHQSLQDSTILPILSPEVMEETQSENGDVTATDNNKLVTYDDSEFWLTFEDGTKVHLNYNTTLKYPSHFSVASRTVYLDGEAYFQIAKDDRPFRVITANGIVKAIWHPPLMSITCSRSHESGIGGRSYQRFFLIRGMSIRYIRGIGCLKWSNTGCSNQQGRYRTLYSLE